MNIVLLADKKHRKGFEQAVKDNPDIALLGVEMLIRGNTMSRIAEHHNPHALVIWRGVTEKDGVTAQDLISFLRMKKPSMRMIYVYGEVTDTVEFLSTVEVLQENGITDVVTSTDLTDIVQHIEHPMTADDLQALLDDLLHEDEQEEQTATQQDNDPQNYEELHLDFPSVTAAQNFDIDKIMTFTRTSEQDKPITIGIMALQHHNGCTHTSFEIAGQLAKKYSAAICMADRSTLDAYAGFHQIATGTASEGLTVRGIDVYPYDKLREISGQYSATVCDFGYFREEYTKAFGECDVRIMLCSGAEWDVPLIMKYVNYPTVDYVRRIFYCFTRTTAKKFQAYNRQLMKAGCVAFRLHNSPAWTTPHKENTEIYRKMLDAYRKLPEPERVKRKLFRVK